jgi:hypothetical protein
MYNRQRHRFRSFQYWARRRVILSNPLINNGSSLISMGLQTGSFLLDGLFFIFPISDARQVTGYSTSFV